jgi:hypothetical protein
VCTGDGEKAAFEKDGRSRGRPTPISPLVVSMVFAPARELHPGKRTGAHPTSFLIRGVLNYAEFRWFEQKSAEFRTFTNNQTDIFIEAGNGDEDVEVTTALRLKAQSVSSSE